MHSLQGLEGCIRSSGAEVHTEPNLAEQECLEGHSQQRWMRLAEHWVCWRVCWRVRLPGCLLGRGGAEEAGRPVGAWGAAQEGERVKPAQCSHHSAGTQGLPTNVFPPPVYPRLISIHCKTLHFGTLSGFSGRAGILNGTRVKFRLCTF